mmetsp:Transcript_34705/g.83987  ORF Transcript_34705/g.83987 Transcript_34705/m.83987 type:complete len:207 (+) Transcript_34705:1959-2579(+)
MRDPFNGIGQRVRKIVHWVDAPVRPRPVVRGAVLDTIQHRVPQEHVGIRHVDLGSEDGLSVFELPLSHLLEQLQILLRSTVSVRRRGPGDFDCSSHVTDLFWCARIHKRVPLLDQGHRVVVEGLEVVRGIEHLVRCEAQPFDVVYDGVYVLHVLCERVCIVEAEVAFSFVFLGQPEIEADRLGVADVQVSVWLGRKPRGYEAIRRT